MKVMQNNNKSTSGIAKKGCVVLFAKRPGSTSFSSLFTIKHSLKTSKVGHTGTLDPLATGVLPILIGDTTKLSKYLIEHDKIYIAKVTLGEERTTGDLEGEVSKKEDFDIKSLSKEKITEVLESFLGESEQVPSVYSAIKVNGKKLYEYATTGNYEKALVDNYLKLSRTKRTYNLEEIN